jgi:hypothetical protein
MQERFLAALEMTFSDLVIPAGGRNLIAVPQDSPLRHLH